jgi:dTDP-glucose 4,6-dehydratase/UDP-glucuronate decarboxylase
MRELATMLLRVAGSQRQVIHTPSEESDYLTDSPNRRCPNLSKARSLLGYEPRVDLESGLRRLLEWYGRFVELEELVNEEVVEQSS